MLICTKVLKIKCDRVDEGRNVGNRLHPYRGEAFLNSIYPAQNQWLVRGFACFPGQEKEDARAQCLV